MCKILEGFGSLLAPHTHSLCNSPRTVLARHNARYVAEEAGKAVGLVGWWAGWGGEPGEVAGRVGSQGGWPGCREAAGSGGWQGGQRGIDLWSKECS